MGLNFLFSPDTVNNQDRLQQTLQGGGKFSQAEFIRILLVEDDNDFAQMLEWRLLKQKNPRIEPSRASAMRDAVIRLAKEHYDLILLDLTLPDSREMETYMKIHSAAPHTPIVILTGWGDDAAAIEAVHRGAEDFLIKGEIDGRMIPRVIHYALERHRIKEELSAATQRLHEMNATIERRTVFDFLTGTFNRRGFQRVLEREIQWAARHGWNLLAMMVDLDRFTELNSLRGYGEGDAALKECALVMKKIVRTTDHISRIAADKFVLLLPETPFEEGMKIAERIRIGISECALLSNSDKCANLTASVSLIQVYGMTGSADVLISRLYSLVKKCKAEGGNKINSEKEPVEDLDTGEADLEKVVSEMRNPESFYSVKQPIIRLLDMKPAAYEFLCRLKTSQCRMPSDFFRIALENNMLSLVDYNCFLSCMEAYAAMLPGIEAACHVNLLPSTILDVAAEDLISALPSGAAPENFCFEISEEQIFSDPAYLARFVGKLKKEGVKIGLDDVGYGQSSIESLVVLEPDIVKLDSRYVHGISQDQERLRYLERMVRACKELGAKIVAEGIETRLDLNAVISAGVEYGQGHFLGAPA